MIKNNGFQAVDLDYQWQELETCPQGVKVQLLTRHGVAIYGQYRQGDTNYVAWAPLPKTPMWAKRLMTP